MSSQKRTNQWGVLAKIESTYGTDASPVAGSDGLLVAERPVVSYSHIHDGSRVGESAPQSRSPARRVAASGKEAEVTFTAEAIGAGSAYASDTRPSLDVLLRMAGLDATVDTTTGSETVTYTPAGSGFESGTVEVYSRGQLDKLLGAYAESFNITADGPVVPSFEFPVRGLGEDESDASIPDITSYPAATLLPPKATSINLSLNSVTSLKVRGFTFELGQSLSQRADENSTGHAGFTFGNLEPTLEVTVEAESLSTLNPYALRDNKTVFATTLDVGSTQYNRWKLQANQCQVLEVNDEEDDASAIWTLQLGLYPSDYVSTDHFSLIFD